MTDTLYSGYMITSHHGITATRHYHYGRPDEFGRITVPMNCQGPAPDAVREMYGSNSGGCATVQECRDEIDRLMDAPREEAPMFHKPSAEEGPPPEALVALLTTLAAGWDKESRTIGASGEGQRWTRAGRAYGEGYQASLDRCSRDLRKAVAEITATPEGLIDQGDR
jgi:hypothetical protein